MRISDLLRRLASHFSSSPRPSETKEKKPAPSNSSGTSLAHPTPITSDKMPGTVNTPAEPSTSRFNAIPGPLGLASASLEGKVALVTGAGTFSFFFSPPSHFRRCGVSGTAVWEHKRPIAAVWGLAAGGEPSFERRSTSQARTGRQIYPNSKSAAARGTPHPTTTHPLSAISSGPFFGWHGD